MTRINTAAIYCRICKDAEQEGLGVGRQREDCIALAEREGYRVEPGNVFVDDDCPPRGSRVSLVPAMR